MKLLRIHGLGAALVAASLMLSACGGTDVKNPESVAKAFMEVAQSVEYGRSKVAAHFDVFRFVPMHEKRSAAMLDP